MAIRATHEIHKRRFGRNLGVALLLVGFIVLTFSLTLAKITGGDISSALPAAQEGSN
jgi:hypothetical protein